jgi:hypothetical protein
MGVVGVFLCLVFPFCCCLCVLCAFVCFCYFVVWCVFVDLAGWSYGVMVSTLDFESSDPGSSPGRTSFLSAV